MVLVAVPLGLPPRRVPGGGGSRRVPVLSHRAWVEGLGTRGHGGGDAVSKPCP